MGSRASEGEACREWSVNSPALVDREDEDGAVVETLGCTEWGCAEWPCAKSRMGPR